MANSSLNLSSLDFDTLKENFKKFLKSQDVFKDYDFDGSNINVLLDVMSYNSYLNSFYLNMVASEMFLDSAQRYDSIVSHSKELNYTARSATSAASVIEFDIKTSFDPTDTNSSISKGYLTIPKGTKFSGINANGTYNYATREKYEFKSSNSLFRASNVYIYEGSYFKESYVVNYDIENQRFLISNKDIDIDSITVNVTDRLGAQSYPYIKAKTLFGLNQSSNVFFIQAAENNLYELVFGDGYFGSKPINGSTVTAEYMVTSGSSGGSVKNIILSDDLGRINGGVAEPQTISVSSIITGGANQESIESVRFAAPRYFATQQRAISTDDYSSLIKERFGGEISDVAIIGGETTEPKKYGRVIVSIKPIVGIVAPNYIKSRIAKYMRDYIAIPNRIEFSDPTYFFCKVKTTVEYDIFSTNKSSTEIGSDVLSAIKNYSKTNLEKFNNDLRYSRLVSYIDNADNSITSNETDIRMISRISPEFNYPTKYVIDLRNSIFVDPNVAKQISDTVETYGNTYDQQAERVSVISSTFSYNKVDPVTGSVTVYPFAFFLDDGVPVTDKGVIDTKTGKGKLNVFALVNNVLVNIDTIGSVSYDTGVVQIDNINLAEYESYVSIYIKTKNKDVIAKSDNIIIIDPNDVTIKVNETKR